MRRASVGLLACLAAIGAFVLGPVSVSGARPAGAFSDALSVADTGAVTFSAVVHPHGRATTAFFQFGLAARYREPMPSHPVYDNSTTAVHLAPAFHVYSVSGTASGLVPNALYNLRLVARSSAGTVNSPNATFRTAKDPAPRLPRIGADVNLVPVSGLVLIRPPRANTSRAAAAAARLVAGPSFHPLTEARQLPIGSQIDARAGSLRLVAADSHGRQTQRVTLTGGVFSLAQSTQGSSRGLTTVNLLQDDFSGAPAYDGCAGHGFAVLQTVHALDQGGRFVTLSRDSSTTATSAGTAWDTSVRCDGTLTVVRHGTVVVFDYPRHQTVAVQAGQRYLANAS
jgi:hypothetical protein